MTKLITTAFLSMFMLTGARADQFDDLRSRLAQHPTDVSVFDAVVTEALTFELRPEATEDAVFFPLRWAISGALRTYVASYSLQTVPDLVRLRRVLTLIKDLRVSDVPTIHLVHAIQLTKAPLSSRVFRTAWQREFDLLQNVALQTLRTLASINDRSHAKYSDPDWNERDGSDCARKLSSSES